MNNGHAANSTLEIRWRTLSEKPCAHNFGLALTSLRASDASLPICGCTDFTFFLNCKLTILPSFSTVSLQLSAYMKSVQMMYTRRYGKARQNPNGLHSRRVA